MVEKLNIVFDTEGVLVDAYPFIFKYAPKYFKKKYNMDVVNPDGYGVKEIFNCTEEQEKKFWLKHSIKYLLLYPPRKDVVDAIKKLRAEGHKVYNLTSKRGSSKEENLKHKILKSAVTLLYKLGLKIHGVKFDDVKVFFSKNDNENTYDLEKYEFIKNNNIDLVIEDKPANVMEFSKLTNTLCMDAKTNKDIECDSKRVYHGNHIYTEARKVLDKKNNTESIFSTFTKIPKEIKKNFSVSEKLEYYRKMKEYILSLPFDEKQMKKGEKNFVLISKLMSLFFKLKYKPVVINKELVPNANKKGYIVAFNHLCDKDVKLIISALKNIPLHPLAKIEFLDENYDRKVDKKAGKYFRIVDSVFVDRKDPISRSISTVEGSKRLLRGGIMLMSPEGTYNLEYPDKNLRDFSGNSIVYYSQAYGLDVIAVTLTKDYNREKGEHPTIRISEPFNVSKEENLDDANKRLWNFMDKQMEENKRFYCFITDNVEINKRVTIDTIENEEFTLNRKL